MTLSQLYPLINDRLNQRREDFFERLSPYRKGLTGDILSIFQHLGSDVITFIPPQGNALPNKLGLVVRGNPHPTEEYGAAGFRFYRAIQTLQETLGGSGELTFETVSEGLVEVADSTVYAPQLVTVNSTQSPALFGLVYDSLNVFGGGDCGEGFERLDLLVNAHDREFILEDRLKSSYVAFRYKLSSFMQRSGHGQPQQGSVLDEGHLE